MSETTRKDPADHPPKPHLTLRAGITGHRPKPAKFPPASVSWVEAKLRDVFAGIDDALKVLAEKNRGLYSAGPSTVRLVSGLAEGADQIAVAVKPDAWALDAVLPFPRQSYIADFQESAAGGRGNIVAEFEAALAKATTVLAVPDDARVAQEGLTPNRNPVEYRKLRDAGYVRSGGLMLRQIDVLVAVWDGQREEGAGGTAHMVRGAVEAGIPVVWISTLENTFPRMVEDIDDDGRPVAPNADCLRGALLEALSTIVSLPTDVPSVTADRHGHMGAKISKRLDDFFAEKWPKPSRWVTYDLFKRWIEGKKLRLIVPAEALSGYEERWGPFLKEAPDAGPLAARIADILLPRYAWADALAVDHANRYRAAYFNSFLMAAGAVCIALIGLFAHELFERHEVQLAFKTGLVFAELVLLWRIYKIVKVGRGSRWRERWVEYRALAEMLWGARFLAYFAEHGHVQRADDLEPTASAWFLWYLRATIREIGLPNAVLDGTYQRAHLAAVEKHVIVDQINYHRQNAVTPQRMYHVLHRTGEIFFTATFVLLALFGSAWLIFAAGMTSGDALGRGGRETWIEGVSPFREAPLLEKLGALLYHVRSWVTFTAALLPTAGAVLGGIRESGDFERFSAQSAKTAAALEELRGEVAQAKRKLKLDTTLQVLLSTAQVLTEDLVAWQAVYGRKSLDLPG